MATINFLGLVTAWQPNPRHAYQLIICCMACTGPKTFHLISLEGDFISEIPDSEPEIGSLVYGEAKILKVWDGSILVEFRKDKLRFNCVENCWNFANNPLKFVYAPRAARQVHVLARDFYRKRLSPEYYPNQLNWYVTKRTFGNLVPGILRHTGYSMAKIEGNALFVTRIKNNRAIKSLQACAFETSKGDADKIPYRYIKGKKGQEKFAVFLLSNMTCEIHNPTFMISRMEKKFPIMQGQIYHFREVPILAVEDDIREEESTLFCGIGTIEPILHPDEDLLLQFYDELGNCEMMPDWLWDKYFSGKMGRYMIQMYKRAIAKILIEEGVDIPTQVHGWWYYWGPLYSFHAQGEEEIAVIAPDFRDAGPSRVVILPMNLYKKHRRTFPQYASAVSISEDPQIIEGSFKPSPGNWELLKDWIISNRPALENDCLDIDDNMFF